VARMGVRGVPTWIRWRDLREANHLENLGLDGRIILNWILKNRIAGRGLDLSGSGQGQVTVCFRDAIGNFGIHKTWQIS